MPLFGRAELIFKPQESILRDEEQVEFALFYLILKIIPCFLQILGLKGEL